MFKRIMMKHDKASDVPEGGSPTSETTSTTTGYETTPPPIEEKGDQFDEFGYKIVAKESGKETEKPREEAAPVEEKLENIKDPSTGYGVKPLEEPKPEEIKIETPPVEVKPPEEIIIDTKGLGEKDIEKLKGFIKENKLPKEAAQKLIDMRKSEVAESAQAQIAFQKQEQIRIAGIKSSWDKELRNDKVFGGEKFDKNVVRIEKVLSEFLPDTKKELTARGSMLPPYVMRDLAKLADKLYNPENFVAGDLGGVEQKGNKEEKESDPLDFYNS